jgi:hypothetical protein
VWKGENFLDNEIYRPVDENIEDDKKNNDDRENQEDFETPYPYLRAEFSKIGKNGFEKKLEQLRQSNDHNLKKALIDFEKQPLSRQQQQIGFIAQIWNAIFGTGASASASGSASGSSFKL